jgi:dihydrofolate reductase
MTIVAAIGPNGGIGLNGRLPWRNLPGDLPRFKKMTMGKPVIMGRLTFGSIGRPLPGRTNIVISSNRLTIPGIIVTKTFADGMSRAGNDDVFVIGGSRVFEEALDHCQYAALTLVREPVNADTFFPVAKFNGLGWDTLARWPEQGWDGVLVRRSPHPTMPFKLEVK